MKKVFVASKSFQLLMNWGFFEIDEDTQKRSVVPASPSVIDSAINEFVSELKAFIWGDANFDGENITGKQYMVQKFTTISTELLELQAIWKRAFLRNHVHIFLAFFRVFANGDMTILLNRTMSLKSFTKKFSWETIGLWYMVSY
jgi:hypothetical protein